MIKVHILQTIQQYSTILHKINVSFNFRSRPLSSHRQGRSHQYRWPGFNQTIFRGNNHISANILEFGSAPADQLAATCPQLTE